MGYKNAAHARSLISDVAQHNNNAFNTLATLAGIKDRLDGLSASDRTDVDAAITSLAHDPVEIAAILDQWAAVRTEAQRLTIKIVKTR